MNTSTDTMLEVKDPYPNNSGPRGSRPYVFQCGSTANCGDYRAQWAGKTTVFNLISGIIPPTSGKILLDAATHYLTVLPPSGYAGHEEDISRDPPLPGLDGAPECQVRSLPADGLLLVDALLWSRRLRSEEQAITELARELLDQFDLAGTAHERADSLPYGMQKRLEIVKAIVSSPKVLLLDEAGCRPQIGRPLNSWS